MWHISVTDLSFYMKMVSEEQHLTNDDDNNNNNNFVCPVTDKKCVSLKTFREIMELPVVAKFNKIF